MAIALLAALGGDSWGQSQQPSPRSGKGVEPPQTQSRQPDKSTTADQRGTEQSPVIVKVLPPENEKQKSEAEARREDEKAANDHTIARFTERLFWATVALSVVAIFQLIAFLWQGIQLQRTVGTTIAIERARFHIVLGAHDLDRFIAWARRWNNSDGMPLPDDIHIEYTFKNYGRTPGTIREISHGIALSETPPDPTYQVIRQAPKEYMIPAGGSTEIYPFDGQLAINTISDAKQIESGKTTVWFFGRFDYLDIITKKPQVHRFYLRYIRTDGGNFRFQTFDYKHYNQST